MTTWVFTYGNWEIGRRSSERYSLRPVSLP